MSLINKERKKERKKTERVGLNFYLTNQEEDVELLDRIETLRHRDRWTFTRFMKEACLEYVNRHLPGNPALPLTHWTENEPLSPAAQEKLSPIQNSKQTPCPDHSGDRCRHCGGLGFVYEEAV